MDIELLFGACDLDIAIEYFDRMTIPFFEQVDAYRKLSAKILRYQNRKSYDSGDNYVEQYDMSKKIENIFVSILHAVDVFPRMVFENKALQAKIYEMEDAYYKVMGEHHLLNDVISGNVLSRNPKRRVVESRLENLLRKGQKLWEG